MINLPEDDVIRLYSKEHIASTIIAQRFNVGCGVILRILRNHHVQIRDKNKQRKILIGSKELYELYIVKKLTSKEIANNFSITPPTVLRLLHEYGITVRGKYDGLSHKNTISIEELPKLFINPHYTKGKWGRRLSASLKCPVCFKTRIITCQSRTRINDIVKSEGKCKSCSRNARSILIGKSKLTELYTDKRLTAKQIGKILNISDMTVRKKLKEYHIPIRNKGELHKKIVHNKGTIESPCVGDNRKGIEIGLNDNGYYTWVQCPKCNQFRWIGDSHIKRDGLVCLRCAIDPTLDNKGTVDNPEVGDIHKGKEINKLGRFYKWVICPECNNARWESKGHALKLHLCKACATRINGENHRGDKSSFWKGGISLNPYSPDFNKRLKEQIRQRDNYTCQLCGSIRNSGIALAIHHIDYNKLNCHPNNLISLCPPEKGSNCCHPKTNTRRDYWQKYFNKLMEERGLLI